MIQCMPGTLARQLVVYRQRIAVAPVLLECETLSRDNITRVLQARGVDYVGRQHQRRQADFRRGQRLGYEDHLISWAKPAHPAWLDEATYQQVPDGLQVREVRVRVPRRGCRTRVLLIVTTLLTPTAFTKEDMPSCIVAAGMPNAICGRSRRRSG